MFSPFGVCEYCESIVIDASSSFVSRTSLNTCGLIENYARCEVEHLVEAVRSSEALFHEHHLEVLHCMAGLELGQIDP